MSAAVADMPAVMAAEAFGAAIDGLTSRIANFADASKAASEQAGSAFQNIGDTAKQQLGAIATDAINAFADATLAAMKTGELSTKSLEKAMKSSLANSLKIIGQEATLEGALSLAKGFAALAGVATAGLAPPHFAAAAMLFGVAAAAGAAAGALGGKGGGGGGGGGSSKDAAVEPSGSEGGESEGGNITQLVTVIGNLDTASAELLQGQLAEAEKKRDLS